MEDYKLRDLCDSHTLGWSWNTGTGTPKDKDEVNTREVCACEGWVWDLDAIGAPSRLRLMRKAAAFARQANFAFGKSCASRWFFSSFCSFFPRYPSLSPSCLFVSKCLIVREKSNLWADVCLTSLFSLRCSFLPIMFVRWIKSKDASCCYYVRCRLPPSSWHHPSVWNFPVFQLTFPFLSLYL